MGIEVLDERNTERCPCSLFPRAHLVLSFLVSRDIGKPSSSSFPSFRLLKSPDGPGKTVEFASIAVRIEIGEFYHGLEFDEDEEEDE